MYIPRLVVIEPPSVVDVHAGTFTYTAPNGEAVTAEFFVRTCEADQTEQDYYRDSKRQSDLNEQYTAICTTLLNDGNKLLKFKCARPDPFF